MPVLDKPQLINLSRAKMRQGLIAEEASELLDAIILNDLVGILDALMDLEYVVNGAILEFGMKDIAKDAFAEVHRSNMSKTCHSRKEAEETQRFYADVVTTIDDNQDGTFNVIRHDGKLLKSVNYSKADLRQFV